jgi:hypothetical protein
MISCDGAAFKDTSVDKDMLQKIAVNEFGYAFFSGSGWPLRKRERVKPYASDAQGDMIFNVRQPGQAGVQKDCVP